MNATLKRGGGYRKIHMGSLYLDDNLAYGGDNCCTTSCYSNQSLVHIGDTVKGNEIIWIKPEGTNKFVADRVIFSGISWDSMELLGLTSPRYTIIDGNLFVCRLLEL